MAPVMVVEDGTGKTDSNLYLTIAELKAYWDNMGYDYSALSDEEIEVLLIKNTRIVEGMYGPKWPGSRNTTTQALGWPRTSATYLDGIAIDTDVVPPEVQDAVAESAYVESQGTDLQPVDDMNNIEEYMVKVDVITEKTKYGDSSGSERPESSAVKDALVRLIRFGKYGGMGVIRI